MKRLVCELCESTDLIKKDGYYLCLQCGIKYTPAEAKQLMVEVGTIEPLLSEEDLKEEAQPEEISVPAEPAPMESLPFEGDTASPVSSEPVKAAPKKPSKKNLVIIGAALAAVLIAAAIILIISGVNRAKTRKAQNASPADKGTAYAEPAEKAAEPAESKTETAAEPAAEPAEEPEQGPKVNYLALGDVIQNDHFTMTFESLDLLPEYSYKTSEYSSTSLYVESGYQLLLVRGHFENTSMAAISDTNFFKTVTVNGEYVVDGYDVRFTFLRDKYFEIDPYTNLEYFLYINIPDGLAAKFDTAEFTLGFNDDMSTPEQIWNTEDGTMETHTDQLYALVSGLGAADAQAANSTSSAAPEEEPAAPEEIYTPEADKQTIELGQTISTDDFDFTLNNVEFTYELKPSNVSSFYNSYPAPDGKVYIHVDGQYYNKSKRDVHIRDLFTPTVDYDDGFTYDGFAVVDEGDNDFTWVSSYIVCTPLETCHYHGLIECPTVVEDSSAPLFITFNIGGETYTYTIR